MAGLRQELEEAPEASYWRSEPPAWARVPWQPRRLKDAQNTAAILTTYNEVDMGSIMDLRAEFKELFEKKHGVKLGFMSFFVKACIHALNEIPSVNAEIDGDDIVYKHFYNIGVAVSAPQGLIVPVLRDADLLSFAGIEQAIRDLGTKATENKLAIEDLIGGTFTISNGGVFGSLMSTPIINPPQSAILGMHKIQERPVAVDGAVEPVSEPLAEPAAEQLGIEPVALAASSCWLRSRRKRMMS